MLALLAMTACAEAPPESAGTASISPDTIALDTLVPPAPPGADSSSHEVPGRDSLPEPVEGTGERPTFERPEAIRGLYLNAWAAGSSRKRERLIRLADTTEINTFVIDIKDASGYVSHASGVETARDAGALGEIRIADLPGLLARLSDAGIYPIARIVIVKDPVLIAHRPEWAVQDTAGGAWVDSKGFVWLNPYDRRVWDYHLELAREVASLGFPEIQWDYVRFPDAPESDMARAVFPDSTGPRAEAIGDLLEYTRDGLADLDVRVTADVFGVTTTFRRDVGIGQLWESFIDRVDAALPMVYPSHYWKGSYGLDRPNAHPYEVVFEAVEDAVRRSEGVEGAGRVIPWLQDFTLGDPDYGVPEVRAQIQAVHDAGIDEWILWNSGSNYTEGALEPTGGFREEPEIRVAGVVVPVSDRHEALAGTRPPLPAAVPDSTSAPAVADTTGVR